MLLGLAGRIGMRMGLHRDPSHYNYSPWEAQTRRQIWHHFLYLDSQGFNHEGAESVMGLASDVQRPRNANDNQWTPTIFSRPASAPPDQIGFTDLTFVIVRNRLFTDAGVIVQQRRQLDDEELMRMVGEMENNLMAHYISHLDLNDPMQEIIAAYYRVSVKAARNMVEMSVRRSDQNEETQSQLK